MTDSLASQKIKTFVNRYAQKRVALVHEFLVQYGGAERVLEALAELFPKAPIYTIVYDANRIGTSLINRTIKTSVLQKIPFGIKHYKKFLLLMPKLIESFKFDGYDLVISDSSSFAKGVITTYPTINICYCHTPTRFIWLETEYYVSTTGVPKFLRPLVVWSLKKMQKWDFEAAQRPDVLIGNSKNVSQRIKKIYHRDSLTIQPFVNVENFAISREKKSYYLMGGRLVQYKRYDLVIEAFKKFNYSLKIFGGGQDRAILEKLATNCPNITFLGRVDDQELKKVYNQAIAYFYPGEEDFGIQPLEAMASGIPVIAYGRGGALETVIEGKTGHFFYNQTPAAIIKAVKEAQKMKFNPEEIRAQALKFSRQRFMIEIINLIEKALEKKT